jgi:hypothetical protein
MEKKEKGGEAGLSSPASPFLCMLFLTRYLILLVVTMAAILLSQSGLQLEES